MRRCRELSGEHDSASPEIDTNREMALVALDLDGARPDRGHRPYTRLADGERAEFGIHGRAILARRAWACLVMDIVGSTLRPIEFCVFGAASSEVT